MKNKHDSEIPNGTEDKNQNLRNMGFVDDFANENIQNLSDIRNREGHVTYSSPLENEKKPKKRVTKMSRKRYRRENTWLFVLSTFLCLVTAASILVMVMGKREKAPSEEAKVTEKIANDIPADSKSDISDNQGIAPEENEATTVSVPNDCIYKGNLILVNFEHKYVFPEENVLVSMFETEKIYSVNSTETYLQKEALDKFKKLTEDLFENSGCDDILVSSAYRTKEKQEEIYQDRVDRFGSNYAASYVAVPGYSEHHTGLALDLSVLANDGLTYDIEEYKDAEWFIKNYKNYGFILRYPVHKASITSIDYEGWHYRYIGLPHSVIATNNDLCLEEYTDYLKSYTYESNILYYSSSSHDSRSVPSKEVSLKSGDFIIYYVPASSGNSTEIPIFDGTNYTISGNNVDGFIVTAEKTNK